MKIKTDADRQDLPKILTSLPGPRARAIIERDDGVLSPSYTRCYPLVAARGEGAIVEDVDGNRFLDFNAGIAVAATGHCHPRVVDAIQSQAARLIHMSGTDFYYENMVDLAERLATSAPGGLPRRVYFGNSGTEAIEAAIDGDAKGYVCVTGGEPLAQKTCIELLWSLCDLGYRVSLETSGAMSLEDVDARVVKVVDVKTPGVIRDRYDARAMTKDLRDRLRSLPVPRTALVAGRAAADTLTFGELLRLAEEERLDERSQRCMSLMLVRSFAPAETLFPDQAEGSLVRLGSPPTRPPAPDNRSVELMGLAERLSHAATQLGSGVPRPLPGRS